MQDAPDKAESDVPVHMNCGNGGQQGQRDADDKRDSVGGDECTLGTTRGSAETFTVLQSEGIERWVRCRRVFR
ncbi:hypothetical protein GCM10022420_028670 [Streptomyces iranensis]|uniref:Uncharacterized protein n=1 Tax=Streptomyces iranensis TaxID=576784 RepID=A0A061A451_9ACTN|nr:predicted protein [Streptomyces iranensis]